MPSAEGAATMVHAYAMSAQYLPGHGWIIWQWGRKMASYLSLLATDKGW